MPLGVTMTIVPPTGSSTGRIHASVGGAIVEGMTERLSRAFRRGVIKATTALKRDLRRQVTKAGLGKELGNAWQSDIYPDTLKTTLHPAGYVYSKSTILHYAFDVGPNITPTRSKFIVIPTRDGIALNPWWRQQEKGRNGRNIPFNKKYKYAKLSDLDATLTGRRRRALGKYDYPRIVFLKSKSGFVAAYYRNADAEPVIVATLVRRVKVPKLLDLAGARQRAVATLHQAVRAEL